MTSIWEKLDRTVKVLIFVAVVQAVLNIVLLQVIAKMYKQKDVTVEFPPGVYVGTEVTAGNNKGYVMLWAQYFIRLVSEFSPRNFGSKVDKILDNVNTVGEKRLKKKLIDELEEIKKNNVYQVFHFDENSWKATWLTRTLWRVEVEGTAVRESSVLSEATRKRTKRRYYIDLRYSESGLEIEDMGYVER
jgi:hypothetical protein